MISVATPAFIAAGAAAALIPLGLHFLVRRPPARAPLPTARFLEHDPRTAVRVQRRPTDRVLLALRILLPLLLGTALAEPRWFPDRAGTAEVVLIDQGRTMTRASWSAAIDEAERLLLAPDGSVRGELVLFDSSASRVPRGRLSRGWLDSLRARGPRPVRSSYLAALAGARAAGADLRGADSVRLTLVTLPTWDGWRPGLLPLRRATWPAAARIPEIPNGGPAAVAAPAAAPRTAMVLGGGGSYVRAALAAVGWRVIDTQDAGALPDAVVVLGPLGEAAAAMVREQVARGATLVVSGARMNPAVRRLLPWTSEAPPRNAPAGRVLWLDGLEIAGAAERAAGGVSPQAALIGSWGDGRPAAAAVRHGSGCVVYLATPLEGGDLPRSAGFPRLVEQLVSGCAPAGDAAPDRRPLDAGARSLLAADDLPAAAAAGQLGGSGGGTPLARWLLGAALALAMVEAGVAYGPWAKR